MTSNNKILAIGLVAALLGGSAGAFIGRSSKAPETAANTTTTNTVPSTALPASQLDAQTMPVSNELASVDENKTYSDGFVEGFRAAREEMKTEAVTRSTQTASYRPATYRSASRSRSSSSSRRAYYDYQPRKRSFWSKHRDKLTVAMGTGAGAAIGGLAGGKKGALIGALAGAGGSALYTYKLRKRN
jgi:hypothetical protein